jgi:hypothetical protein
VGYAYSLWIGFYATVDLGAADKLSHYCQVIYIYFHSYIFSFIHMPTYDFMENINLMTSQHATALARPNMSLALENLLSRLSELMMGTRRNDV